jgi:deoxyribonuclease-1
MVLVALTIKVGLGTEQTGIEDYRTALPLFWSKVYPRGGRTLYCGQRFGARKGRGINVEHVFPMSWVTKALRCGNRQQCRDRSDRFNRIEADLHNLYPARLEINDIRGSFPYGEIRGERHPFRACDFEVDYNKRQVEPRAASRGEIARAMLYMHVTYGLKLYRRQGILMQRWNRDDPPSQEEKRRNDAIAPLQGTRNKFIDAPRAADDLEF